VTAKTAIGIDIGGTGIKASTVDLDTGTLTVRRNRVPTPEPGTPEQVVDRIRGLLDDLLAPTRGVRRTLGMGFPGVVTSGVVRTATHLDKSWMDTDAAALFTEQLGHPTRVINDADAAGLAEVRFGAGRAVAGVVLILTLGTGIGSGLLVDGRLVPNTELGHLEIDGKEAESRAAASVREEHGLSWKRWGRRLNRYLNELERLVWPDLIIIGGGISEHFDQFTGHLHCRTTVVPAQLGNDAGIIGAALWATEQPSTP
jgi:polyphosphate glucokinase